MFNLEESFLAVGDSGKAVEAFQLASNISEKEVDNNHPDYDLPRGGF
jgi:hypothetical protein